MSDTIDLAAIEKAAKESPNAHWRYDISPETVLALCARIREPAKIKPLEWTELTAFAPRASPEWLANHAFGFYVIECSRLVGRFFVPQLSYETFDSLDAAKAAAQSDYESRIRSALITETDNG